MVVTLVEPLSQCDAVEPEIRGKGGHGSLGDSFLKTTSSERSEQCVVCSMQYVVSNVLCAEVSF